jgi:hypothetical protein
MGRGRAKAKQTKVARELKYRNHNTDLDQLQRELSAAKSSDRDSRADIDEADDEYTSSYPRD